MELEAWKVALLSSILGGSFTLFGQLFSFQLQKKTKIRQDKDELNSLLKSFYVEIETLYERYIENFGHFIEGENISNGVTARFIATQDYMTVFNNNAHQIGKIKNDPLRKQILKTYISTKSLLDTYETNNQLLRAIDQLEEDLCKDPNAVGLLERLSKKKGTLKNYAPGIIFIHNDYKKNVQNVLDGIKNEIY